MVRHIESKESYPESFLHPKGPTPRHTHVFRPLSGISLPHKMIVIIHLTGSQIIFIWSGAYSQCDLKLIVIHLRIRT